MKFDLKRPCANCPFRFDVPGYLNQARAEEIADALLYSDQTFSCHKTVDYSEYDGDEGCHIPTEAEQHCAGALIFLEHQERPNQLMRIFERIGFYDRTKLDMDAPVFDDRDAFIDHHDS